MMLGKKQPHIARSDSSYLGTVNPTLDPQQIVALLSRENNGNVGGTIRDGSLDEIFVVGNMIFHVDPAKEMIQGNANCSVKCSNMWSEKINVEEDHAIKSQSGNPVLIAQIPTAQGIAPLLFDGHHRMYKAMSEGRNEVPGYLFTPEETLTLMSAPPDLMYKLRANLKAHHGMQVGIGPKVEYNPREAIDKILNQQRPEPNNEMPSDRFEQIAEALRRRNAGR